MDNIRQLVYGVLLENIYSVADSDDISSDYYAFSLAKETKGEDYVWKVKRNMLEFTKLNRVLSRDESFSEATKTFPHDLKILSVADKVTKLKDYLTLLLNIKTYSVEFTEFIEVSVESFTLKQKHKECTVIPTALEA